MFRAASTVRATLVVMALVLAGWAGAVALTGGGVVMLGPLRLSSRAAARPALAALLLLAAALATASAEERRRGVVRARDLADRAAPWLAAMLALGIGATSAVLNEYAAAGADSAGYLSQSRLWNAGALTVAAPVRSSDGWPQRGWLVSPLGFAPSATPDRLGPTYAPGLPWLMALGAAVGGEAGRFIWTPLAAALLVWLTFRLTWRAAPPSVALGASLLVATSPPVLFAAMQTMSDLLCAVLWLGALMAMTRPGRSAAAIAGLAAGAALAVRPNLAPVAGLVGVVAVATAGGAWPARLRHAVLIGGPMAVAATSVAVINTTLWGSPFASGYGATEDLFVASRVPANVARVMAWTWDTGGVWLLPGVVALAWLAAARPRREWWLGLAVVAGVAASYLPYALFEEWWYLRFYLPAWPIAAAAVTTAAWLAVRRLSDPLAPFVVLGAALAVLPASAGAVTAAGTFDLWRGAQRYPAVADHVARHAPPHTWVLAVQHSGALHDAGHDIGRWDQMAPDALDATVDALDATVDALARAGRTVWLVADDFEEAPFRARFAAMRRGALDWAPLAEARVGTMRTRVYDLTTPTRATAPALIRAGTGSRWPWARRPAGAAK